METLFFFHLTPIILYPSCLPRYSTTTFAATTKIVHTNNHKNRLHSEKVIRQKLKTTNNTLTVVSAAASALQ